MIKQNFNAEKGILEVAYIGEINTADVINFGVNISENKEYPRKLKIITDVTEALYQIPISDLDKIYENLKLHVQDYDWLKVAFIQCKPRETAMSLLFEDKLTEVNYFHKVFCDKEAALAWLMEN